MEEEGIRSGRISPRLMERVRTDVYVCTIRLPNIIGVYLKRKKENHEEQRDNIKHPYVEEKQ